MYWYSSSIPLFDLSPPYIRGFSGPVGGQLRLQTSPVPILCAFRPMRCSDWLFRPEMLTHGVSVFNVSL